MPFHPGFDSGGVGITTRDGRGGGTTPGPPGHGAGFSPVGVPGVLPGNPQLTPRGGGGTDRGGGTGQGGGAAGLNPADIFGFDPFTPGKNQPGRQVSQGPKGAPPPPPPPQGMKGGPPPPPQKGGSPGFAGSPFGNLGGQLGNLNTNILTLGDLLGGLGQQQQSSFFPGLGSYFSPQPFGGGFGGFGGGFGGYNPYGGGGLNFGGFNSGGYGGIGPLLGLGGRI